MDTYEGDDDELFFAVEKIINSRRVRSQVQYRIRWQGYSEEADI